MRTLLAYEIEAVKNGFFFECACGEVYRNFWTAKGCRKCREYLTDHANRSMPVDLRDFLPVGPKV